MVKRVALIARDATKSLSPSIHGCFFHKYNISGEYNVFNIVKEDIGVTVEKLIKHNYIGFNITVPYKESIVSLLDSVSEIATKIGAVNTVLIKQGKLIGYNTDAYGFVQGIRSQLPNFKFQGVTVLVLGAGGASRAIIYALNAENVKQIYLCNRTSSKANQLSEIFDKVIAIQWSEKESFLDQCDLLINTTSLTTNFINLHNLHCDSVVHDVSYVQTELLQQAQQRHAWISGLGMLMWQAELAFRIWFKRLYACVK